ncbi:MAG TPA: 3'-5' exonuclease [Campylobacteraceae bacterium]|nr:3'-5' exonuclease [Campylobacteraceae bacterium]
MICIFDCETIPDTDLIRKQFALEGDDSAVTEEAFRLQEEKSGSAFLPLPMHRVVAISAVISDDFGKFEKVSSIDGKSEEEMIANFLQFIDKHNPKLVSFNGRNFDMPMLMIRAMKYNLSCPAFYDKENQLLGKSKWDNYRYRFSDRFHVDLMDHISEFGAVRGLKLDLLCTMAGIPGKFDVSGDQVHRLYYEGKLDEIKEYCESDVLNTYWLYLKYELLKGNLIREDYLTCLDGMRKRLPQQKSYTDIFTEGIKMEIRRYDSNY